MLIYRDLKKCKEIAWSTGFTTSSFGWMYNLRCFIASTKLSHGNSNIQAITIQTTTSIDTPKLYQLYALYKAILKINRTQ